LTLVTRGNYGYRSGLRGRPNSLEDRMSAIAFVWLVALSVPAIVAWRTWGLLRLNLKVGMNDDRFAQRTFIELLNEARHVMWICDDGDDFPESIYNAEAVVEAVRHRLAENEDLHLCCLFSSNDETRFTKAFANHSRVRMHRGVQPRRDVHFKIIDDARKGYVSAHPPRSFERRYRSYDCSHVPKHIRQAALGRHMDSIAARFPAAQGERAVAG
jgi:hypothetical protein